MYDEFIKQGFLSIKNEYEKRAGFLHQIVAIKVFDKEIIGIAQNITDNGALTLIDDNNKKYVFLTGDIL